MARPVYSTRFAAISLTGAAVSYIVPDGFIAIVRSIQMFYFGGPSAGFGLVQAGGVLATLAYLNNVHGNDYLSVEMRAVVDASEPIKVSCSTGNACSFYVSGYLLTLP